MTTKDFISGLVTPIVIITSTLSYAAMIFSGPLAPKLPLGIGYGLVSAGIMAMVFALGSSMPFAIAGPDSKPVAVLATLAAVIAADLTRRGHAEDVSATVMFVLIAGTLITGVTLYLFGVLKAGRWIRFVPYPVIAGFMAASGALAGRGRHPDRHRHARLLDLPEHLAHGQQLVQLMVSLAFAIGMLLIKRVKHPLAFPALLLGGTLVTHLALHAAGYSLECGPPGRVAPGSFLRSGHAGALAIEVHARWSTRWRLLWAGGGYVALFAVTAMTLLLGLMAIEVETRLDVDLDRELRLNGLANILVGVCGGMTGTLSMSRTLFNYRAGARGRASGHSCRRRLLAHAGIRHEGAGLCARADSGRAAAPTGRGAAG